MADPRTQASALHVSVEVREMEIDDLAPVFHLGEDLFTSDLYPFLYRTWDEWEVIGLYNTDAEYCLVAEVDEQLAGFVLGTIISKASWTYGYIIWLGVHPSFQKRGVADKLVDKLVERMIEEGVRFMLVDTDPRNTPAVRFFKRKGFGGVREHIFLSMNLAKHERYGKLIVRERERERAEKAGRKQAQSMRRRKMDGGEVEPMLRPLMATPGQDVGNIAMDGSGVVAGDAPTPRKPTRRGGRRSRAEAGMTHSVAPPGAGEES